MALLLISLLLARLRQWQEMAGTVRGSIPARPALCLCLSETDRQTETDYWLSELVISQCTKYFKV